VSSPFCFAHPFYDGETAKLHQQHRMYVRAFEQAERLAARITHTPRTASAPQARISPVTFNTSIHIQAAFSSTPLSEAQRAPAALHKPASAIRDHDTGSLRGRE